MPYHTHCAVGFGDNDERYPDLAHVRSHVANFTYHKWPADPKLAEMWPKHVAKTRGDVLNPSPGQVLVRLSFLQTIFRWEEEPWKPQNGLFICLYDRLWLSPEIVAKEKESEQVATGIQMPFAQCQRTRWGWWWQLWYQWRNGSRYGFLRFFLCSLYS